MRYRIIMITGIITLILVGMLASSTFISLKRGEYTDSGKCRKDTDCYASSDCECGYHCVDQATKSVSCDHDPACPFGLPSPSCYCVEGQCTAYHPSEEPAGQTGEQYRYALSTLRRHPYLCEMDADCVNTCQYGAVNREWAKNKTDGCEGGCAGPGLGAPRCINDSCVAFTRDGKREHVCTQGAGTCVEEGEYINLSASERCCTNLKKIAVCDEHGDNCRHAVCADCGDGVCDGWESPHTCKTDCEFKGEYLYYCRDSHCAKKRKDITLPLTEAPQARYALEVFGLDDASELNRSTCTMNVSGYGANVTVGALCWRYNRTIRPGHPEDTVSYQVYGEISDTGVIHEEWYVP